MGEVDYVRIGRHDIAFEKIAATGEAKGSIVMVHGMGEHCWRYNHVVRLFNKLGLHVIRFDLPGHGLSSGKRGHIRKYKEVLAPLNHFIHSAKEWKQPVFVYGHSMGGNVVLGNLILRNPSIKGAIISSPWVALAFKPGFLKTVLAKIANRVFPSYLDKNDLSIYALSQDQKVVEAYEEDDLVHDWISPRMFMEMSKMATRIQFQANKIQVPVFLFHGTGDQITAHWATKRISERIPGAKFISYDSGYHEMHNEPNQTEVFEDIEAFIKDLLGV